MILAGEPEDRLSSFWQEFPQLGNWGNDQSVFYELVGFSSVAVGKLLQWIYLREPESVLVKYGKAVLKENIGEK